MSRLRIRIFLFVLLLAAALLAATLELVQRAARAEAERRARESSEIAAQALQHELQRRREDQQALLEWLAGRGERTERIDSPQALADLRTRLRLDAVALLDPQGRELLADHAAAAAPPWAQLDSLASETRWIADAQSLWLLSQSVLAAEDAEVRLGLAQRLDGAALGAWAEARGLQVSLWRRGAGGEQLLAQSAPQLPRAVLAGEPEHAPARPVWARVEFTPIESLPELVLRVERPILHVLSDYRLLRWQLLAVGLLALMLAAIGALAIGRSISQPLNALARYMRRVSAGEDPAPPVFDRRGEVAALAREFAFMLSSIAQREASIRHLAYQDALTGLANRHQFQERIRDALKAGPELRFVVMVSDVDGFREVNDTLGHAAGDRVLKQVALRLQQVCRPGDVLARLSADEFGVLMHGVSPNELVATLQRYREPFKEPFVIDGISLELSSTVGAAVHPEHGEAAGVLMQRAEIALFQARLRHLGHSVYTPEADRYTLRRLTLMAELRAAIERDQLELYVQPKLDIRAWTIVGVECLVRWVHPDYGFVPPDEFIPLAEQTGTIRRLTDWIVVAGLDWAQRWNRAGYRLKIAVNLSTVDLLDPSLAQRIAALLAERRLPGELLVLEVTESAVMQDPERALPLLQQLRELGIELSIDDFGTGYSSMAQLKRLPVDELKIDKSFVFDVADNPDDAIIVRSTIDLGHNMELRVVAEGVESERALEWLTRFGCDMAQGYHLSRPIPAAELAGWLENSPYLVDREAAGPAAADAS